MAQSEILRISTIHGTQIFVSAELKLIQRPAESNEMPLYAKRTEGGINLLVLKDGVINYVTSLNANFTVELGAEPALINTIDNPDGSVTIPLGKRFFSPRRDGSFLTVPKNLGWEHLRLSETDLFDGLNENIFTVRTFHNTKVFLDDKLNVRHSTMPEPGNLPVYVHFDDKTLNFFVIKSGTVKYIKTIGGDGRAMLTNEPYQQKFSRNVLRKSVSVNQNGQFWSANKKNDRFWLAPRSDTWESFYPEPAGLLDPGKCDVMLVVLHADKLDDVLARLNLNRLRLRSVLIDGTNAEQLATITESKKIPAASFARLDRFVLDGRESYWLMGGGSRDELRKMSEYLQSRGVAGSALVSIEPKMTITNVKAAVEGTYEFIVTGGLSMAVGLDVDRIFNRKGINLAAEGQDLRQSYLTAKYVLERNRSIQFVLIGLTPEMLFAGDDEELSRSGRECQYVLNKENTAASLEDNIFNRLLKEIELPTEATADPNQTELKKSAGQKYSVSMSALEKFSIDDDKLCRLEEYIRLCMDHKVKPVGVLLPTFDQSTERNNLLRRVARWLEKIYEFKLIDLTELPLTTDYFSDSTHLNMAGASVVGNVLDYRLHDEGILPFEEMRQMDYERLLSLRSWLGMTTYNGMKERLFDATIDVLKHKEKIKVGFVVYDSAMWCGDELYHLFADNERYEATLFLCLRMDERSSLIADVYRRVHQHNVTIPKQDVFIYLTPYFNHLPRPFRLAHITPETLITHIPYGLSVSAWVGGRSTHFHIENIYWKLFILLRIGLKQVTETKQHLLPQFVYSGAPKMDIFFSNTKSHFDWKMTHPSAIKIIWAPHWSIRGFATHRMATFQWNYKFFYEYAAAHPETSWVVKPHPQLLYSAVSTGVFPSEDAFREYLRKWDELPNAKVVTGGYYQDVFRTSDGMILDSCSFTNEYQFTHKPMLFLIRSNIETELNEIGQKVVNAGYHVDGKDFEGIKNFIEDVLIKKNDPLYDARMKVFDEELNYYKHNGMLASEKIFKTIDDALKP